MNATSFLAEKRQQYKYFTLTLLVLGVMVVLAGCSHQDAAGPAIRPALAYKIGTDSGTDNYVYAGEIRARLEADHAFRLGGKLAQRLVDTGATVRKGQPLARLDPQDVKLAADAASAQVAAQQTDADFAEAEFKRYQELFTKGFISQSALDQKRNVAQAAKARLDASRAQASVSINQAGYATLVAEMDGVVTQVLAEAGQVVTQGQPVVRIANPREKELAISAPEGKLSDFKSVLAGKSTRILQVASWNQPDKYYPARIREIGGAADPVTRTYPIRLTLANADDALQLGMTAYAVFVGANDNDALSVPLSAVYVQGQSSGVWQIAADGKVSLKPVTVVQFRETTALIKAINGSVKTGDTIVAAGVHKLREGEVVKPVVDPLVTGDSKVAIAPSPALPTVAQGDHVALLKRLFN
jgi:RND family efflux transporter MFP subunit